ncbi:hypothetical protein [Priestia megaterium]
MSINYKFNEWRVEGEKAKPFSGNGYKLLRCNLNSSILNGFTIGQVLYCHHVKGLSVSEIRKNIGVALTGPMIRSVIKGFGRNAGWETIQAYNLFMEMLRDEPEVLDAIYS